MQAALLTYKEQNFILNPHVLTSVIEGFVGVLGERLTSIIMRTVGSVAAKF